MASLNLYSMVMSVFNTLSKMNLLIFIELMIDSLLSSAKHSTTAEFQKSVSRDKPWVYGKSCPTATSIIFHGVRLDIRALKKLLSPYFETSVSPICNHTVSTNTTE